MKMYINEKGTLEGEIIHEMDLGKYEPTLDEARTQRKYNIMYAVILGVALLWVLAANAALVYYIIKHLRQ